MSNCDSESNKNEDINGNVTEIGREKGSDSDDGSDQRGSYTGANTRRNSVFTKTYNPEDKNKNEIQYDTLKDEEESVIENIEKSQEIKSKLENILRSIIMFKNLLDNEMNDILDNMFMKRCNVNDVIIRECDDGNYFYVIEKGVYNIYKKNEKKSSSDNTTTTTITTTTITNGTDTNYGEKIGEYDNNGYFGELALLYDQPRSATIVSASNDGVLWVMHRETFQRVMITNSFNKRKMYETFLSSVPLLQQCMNDNERSAVADALNSHTYTKGECILKDGDHANGMYFIEQGQVEIVKTNCEGNSFNVVLNEGDYFGELAIINQTQRSASAYAFSDNCRVAFLDREAFYRLMGPCLDVIKNNINQYRTV